MMLHGQNTFLSYVYKLIKKKKGEQLNKFATTKVVIFYSYKGGVGRSLAVGYLESVYKVILANKAAVITLRLYPMTLQKPFVHNAQVLSIHIG